MLTEWIGNALANSEQTSTYAHHVLSNSHTAMQARLLTISSHLAIALALSTMS